MQAVKVVGLFITEGIVVMSKYSNGEVHYFRDMDSNVYYTGPMIVLTSKLTASAAEIVAQALKDYGIAVIVGDDQTYGKGSIQLQTVTGDDAKAKSFFKVTVGRYYTVSGESTQIDGVEADIVVPTIFSHSKIGEKYLENPLTSGKINPAYEDKLQDVDEELKDWYVKYYLPRLQLRQLFWKPWIPVLKKNCEYRLSQNKNFQFFLKSIESPDASVAKNASLENEDTEEEEDIQLNQRNYGVSDLQMAEAVNILKDMIILPGVDHLFSQEANTTASP